MSHSFHSGCVISHSYQQCTQVPVSPHPSHTFLPILHLFSFCWVCFILFFDRSHLHWCEGYLVVLICISLVMSEIKHLFVCLSVIPLCSLKNAYSTPSLIFHSDCFLLFLTYRSSLYVLDNNPLSDTVWFASIFFQMFSHPVNGVLWSRKCLVCLFLLLLPVLLVSYTRNHCQGRCQKGFSVFSSSSFTVPGLLFKAVIRGLFCFLV